MLSDRLGIQLHRVGSGHRLTFTASGENELSNWMAEHARVTWAETPEPWLWEERALRELDLPLNLQGNDAHPFRATLAAARASARAEARHLPIAT